MLSFVQVLSLGAPGYFLRGEQVVPIRGASRIDASPTALLPRQSNRKNKAVDRAVNIADGPQSIDLLRDRLHEYLYLPDIMGGRTAAYRLALPPGSPSLGAKSVRIAH